MNPAIVERIVIIWMGGHSLQWPDTNEFNMRQDVAAARVVFGCGVPLVQIPGLGVSSAFTISEVELVKWLTGDFTMSHIIPCPIPEYDNHYAVDVSRHFMGYVYHVNRDALVTDLSERLQSL